MKILVVEPEKKPYVREISDDIHEMQEVVDGLIELWNCLTVSMS